MTPHQLTIATTVLVTAVAVQGCGQKESENPPPTTNTPSESEAIRPPTSADLPLYTKDLPGQGALIARFTTTKGVIHCELFEEKAPMTVANFVGLARGLHPFKNPQSGVTEKRPFYNGLIFHRVIPEFMIQGGDILGTGSGGPGYQFGQEVSPELKHDRPGRLSMANAGPGTNGSQFFITEVPASRLDGGYNVFGQCMEIDVVGNIARVERQGEAPVNPIVLTEVNVFRDDISKYKSTPFSNPPQ